MVNQVQFTTKVNRIPEPMKANSISNVNNENGLNLNYVTIIQGRILKGVGGNYQILLSDGSQVTATPRGILRRQKISPYPGDIVDLSSESEESEQYSIDNIHERKSFLIRPAIANIDLMLITVSASSPKPDCFLIDKLIILCYKAGISVALCITKADLDQQDAIELKEKYKEVGIPIFILGDCEENSQEFDEMKNIMQGKIVSFAGQSGVGKSTLLNKIFDKQCMDIGTVSEKIGRGKHTTRHSEIFVYESGLLADTPGFSSLELEELEITGPDVLKGYPEIEKFESKCKFADCRHIGETGCAIDESKINPERLIRYRQYRKNMDEIHHYDLKKKNRYEK